MLRPATVDDLPLLREMLYEAAFLAGTRPTIEEALADPLIGRYLDGWGRPGDAGLVAVDDDSGEPLGAAWYRSFTATEPGFGYVDEATPEVAIACRAGARGQGLGHQLIAGLLDRAAADGTGRLSLSVNLGNAVARLVYFDCGFRDVRPPEDGHATMVAATDPGQRPAPPTVRTRTRADLADPRLAGGSWGETVVSLGRVHRMADLDGLVSEVDDEPAGLLTWRLDDADGVEVVTIDAFVDGAGVGTALLRAVRRIAREAGRSRLWLITTNDNLPALSFYQRRGWDLVALHRHEADEARLLKPSIPIRAHGIPIHHGLELERHT